MFIIFETKKFWSKISDNFEKNWKKNFLIFLTLTFLGLKNFLICIPKCIELNSKSVLGLKNQNFFILVLFTLCLKQLVM